ncbi:hypothetical protein D9M72_480900 [compost metagenome]
MQGSQPVGLPLHQAVHSAPELVPCLPYPVKFLHDVRNNPLGGVRGRGSPEVSDVVEDGTVRFVADRADHRRRGVGHCPDQILIAEGEEVLKRTAAPGNHNDVNMRVGIEVPQRTHNLGNSGVSLHGNFPDLKFDRGPPEGGIAQHVLLGVGITSGDQTDPMGEEREAFFPGVRKEPFHGKRVAESLNPRQQVSQPHRPDVLHRHVEASGLQPELGFQECHHPGTPFQGNVLAIQHIRPDGRRQRNFGVYVPKCHERAAAAAVQFNDLAFDPGGGSPVDVGFELLGQ